MLLLFIIFYIRDKLVILNIINEQSFQLKFIFSFLNLLINQSISNKFIIKL